MIYLASPYSDEDESEMAIRFRKNVQTVAWYYQRGKLVFSPIVHNHPIAVNYSLPRTWEFWSQFDLPMLDLATELHVLRLKGWDTSTGVTFELAHARNRNINIQYIDWPLRYA